MQKLREERANLETRYQELYEQLQHDVAGGELEDINITVVRIDLSNLKARMAEIDDVLEHAKPLGITRRTSKVGLGKTIYIRNGRKEQEVTLVDSIEADPDSGSVSIASPLGNALLGKRLGDIAEVTTPRGPSRYQIVSIK
jgi:transcription elongation factor GreA